MQTNRESVLAAACPRLSLNMGHKIPASIRISVTYGSLGLAWVLLTRLLPHDSLLGLLLDLLLVGVTAGMLYLLLRHEAQRSAETQVRIEAQAAQHRSEEARLRQVLDSLEDVAYTVDLEGRFTALYGAWLALGIVPETMLGRTAAQCWSPQAALPHRHALDALLAGQDDVIYEWTSTAIQPPVTIQTRLSLIKAADGAPLGVVGIGREITANRQLEHELEDLIRNYRALMRCNRAVIHATDEADLLQAISYALMQSDAYNEVHVAYVTGVPGTPSLTWKTAAQRQPHADTINLAQAALASRQVKVGEAVFTPASTNRRRLIALPLLAAGELLGVMVICTSRPDAFGPVEADMLYEMTADLSHGITTLRARETMRHTQRQMIASEGRYRAMFMDHSAPMLRVELVERRIQDANPAAARFYGYERARLMQMRLDDLSLRPGSVIQRDLTQAAESARHVVVSRHRLANGTTRDVDMRLGAVVEGDGVSVFIILHDVTDTLATESALRLSSERLQLFLQGSTDAIMLFDRNLRVVEINETAASLLARSRQETMGRHLRDLAPANWDVAQIITHYRRVIETGKPHQSERSLPHPSFGEVILSVRAFRVGTGIGLVATDITQRRRAEDAFITAHDVLQKTLASLSEAVLLIDRRSQQIVQANPSAAELFAYDDAANMIGLDIRSLQLEGPLDAPAAEPHYAGGRYTAEVELRRRTGQTFQAQQTIVPLAVGEDNAQVIAVTIVRDISAIKLVDHQVRRSEEQLRTVIQNMPVVLLAFDEERRVIVWNREGEHLTGYSTAEVTGNRHIMAWFFPERSYRETVMQQWERAQGDLRDHITQVTRKDGGQCSIMWNDISAAYPVPGWSAWMIGIDVTDQVQAQQALELANQALEQRVETRTAELLQARAAEHEQRLLAESLRDAANQLNAVTDLESVLDRLLHSIGQVLVHDVLTAHLLDGEVVRQVRCLGQCSDAAPVTDTLLAAQPHLHRMAVNRNPVLISDTQSDPLWQSWEWVGAYIGAPIIVETQVIGFLGAYSVQVGYFTGKHLEHLRAFSDQAALAIHNVRLHNRSRQLAAMEERQRLARDLHDAVTQTLFSASVLCKTLSREAPPVPLGTLRDGIVQLERLNRGALAEMRTMLLELRPEALDETPLDRLLAQLADAFSGRVGVPVARDLPRGLLVDPVVKTVLYRVTHEALTNITRHAQAQQVSITLTQQDDLLALCIADDGVGFDPAAVRGDHFGLKIMEERAATVGGTLVIESAEGQGTQVWLTCPAAV